MNQDFLDLMEALLRAGARFLVVGAHAMAVHGVPRATGDLDRWIARDRTKAGRVWTAVLDFGAPIQQIEVTQQDFETPGMVVQIGLPPRRIDILTEISGVEFEQAWPNRLVHGIGSLQVPFLSKADLIRNKRASGRSKDRADLEILRGQKD